MLAFLCVLVTRARRVTTIIAALVPFFALSAPIGPSSHSESRFNRRLSRFHHLSIHTRTRYSSRRPQKHRYSWQTQQTCSNHSRTALRLEDTYASPSASCNSSSPSPSQGSTAMISIMREKSTSMPTRSGLMPSSSLHSLPLAYSSSCSSTR